MNTTVYLVRHGHVDDPTLTDGTKLVYGPREELSNKGVHQISALTELLTANNVRLDRIFTSPYDRALESAQLLAIAQEIVVEVRPALRATVTHNMDGRPLSLFPNPNIYEIPGTEPEAYVASRVIPEFAALVKENEGKTIALVMHSEEIGILMHALKFPDQPPKRGEKIGNAHAIRLVTNEQGEIIEQEHINPETPQISREREY